MNQETSMRDVHRMVDAALLCINTCGEPMRNDSPENRHLATFLKATQWLLVELSQAAFNGALLTRLTELQQEHTEVVQGLMRAKRHELDS